MVRQGIDKKWRWGLPVLGLLIVACGIMIWRSTDGPPDADVVAEPDAPAVERQAPPDDYLDPPVEDSGFEYPPPIAPAGADRPELVPPRRLADPQTADDDLVPAGSVISWGQADRYVGRTMTVEGRIVGTHNAGAVCFLNFARDWRGVFYVVLSRKTLDDWPQKPEVYFLHRTIRVSGKISLYKGRPQIRVTDASQIEVVE